MLKRWARWVEAGGGDPTMGSVDVGVNVPGIDNVGEGEPRDTIKGWTGAAYAAQLSVSAK